MLAGGRAARLHALVVDQRTPVALTLARACWVEGGFRYADCTAIAYVVQRRADLTGRPWLDMLLAYSALLGPAERARQARTLPWDDVVGVSTVLNARWALLRAHAAAVLAGQRQDPCPGAVHWGGRMDAPRGRMVRLRCDPPTANTFYLVRR